MPDSNLPRWGQVTLSVLRMLGYTATAAAGYGAVFYTPVGPSAISTHTVFHIWGWACLVSSLLCIYASARHRWKIEWVSVWVVGGSLSFYASTQWSLFPATTTRLVSAAVISSACIFLLTRGVELTIFAEQARRNQLRRRERANA